MPENRYGRCGTTPIRRYSVSKSSSRTSTPSTSTEPSVTSNSRGTSDISVVLPAPVLPMIAVTSPGRAWKLMSRRTGTSAPGYRKLAWRNSTPPVPRAPSARSSGWTGAAGGTTDVSVSRTSATRSAQMAARGTIIAMNVAIMTDIRICTRYWRNAVSAPICN